MVDWLLVLAGVSLFLWYVLTNPVLPTFESSELEAAEQGNLERHVTALSGKFSPRMAEFDNLRPPARYIKKQFDRYTKARFQPYVTGVGRVNNVIAAFGPDSRDVIVIGAHYDAHQGMPGADGNASGVAGLIELARIFSKYESLPLRIELVAYALGEAPFFGTREMGSYYHAEQLKQKGKQVKLMMSLDSIGYFTKASGSQNYPYPFMKFFYPQKGNFIKITGRIQDMALVRKVKRSISKVDRLDVRSMTAPEIFPTVGTSDNLSYWRHGFSAVRITDTEGDRNPLYQTDRDTAKTLDYETMARVVQGVGQVVLDVARENLDFDMLMASQKLPGDETSVPGQQIAPGTESAN